MAEKRHLNTNNIRALPPRGSSAEDAYAGEPFQEERERRGRRRHRLLLTLALLFGAILLALQLVRRFMRYDSYAVMWQKDLNQGSLVGYAHFGNGLLKYSKDGVTYLTGRGTEEWVDTYEMKAPIVSVCGNYAAIADCQGNSIRIYGEAGKIGETTTILPLTKLAIADNGITAVIEEDAGASYITFLQKDGRSLDITVKSILSGDGYPTDIALSPDGTRLMVGYEYLSGGDLKGRVVFYDFSEIGKNIPNRLVGGFDEQFSDSLLAEVHYLDGTYSFAASTAGLCFFSSRNLTSPEVVKEVRETDEIRSLFYNNKYVGLILNNSGGQERYRLELYRADGGKVMEKCFDDNYQFASIDGNTVFIHSSTMGMIYNTAGVRKFYGKLDFPVIYMEQGALPGEYIMAGPANIKRVRLR